LVILGANLGFVKEQEYYDWEVVFARGSHECGEALEALVVYPRPLAQ
jgi:hypothetical protein